MFSSLVVFNDEVCDGFRTCAVVSWRILDDMMEIGIVGRIGEVGLDEVEVELE